MKFEGTDGSRKSARLKCPFEFDLTQTIFTNHKKLISYGIPAHGPKERKIVYTGFSKCNRLVMNNQFCSLQFSYIREDLCTKLIIGYQK